MEKIARGRRFFAAALVLLSASVALGCKGSGKSDAGEPGGSKKVKLALNWVAEPEFGGFFAAREGGLYGQQGLDVTILNGGAGAPVVQLVASGEVDFGVVGADELLQARARGVDLVAVFTVYQTFPQAIMAHASRGAKTLKDVLSSGTLAVEPGLPFVAYLKNKYGFEGVKVVPYDGGVARFVADKDFSQECFITSEPLAAKKKGSDPQVFLIADEGYNPYAGVIVARRQLWQEKPEIIKSFVKGSREGWRRYLDDPKPANEVMGKINTAMDAETFAGAAEAQKSFIETADTKTKGLGSMSAERWDKLASQLVELKVMDKAQAAKDFLISVE